MVPGSEAGLSVEAFEINQSANDDYKKLFGSESVSPFVQPYVMRFDIVYDREAYEIESVSVEGLDLNERVNDRLTYSESSITGGVQRRYPFVEEILGGDVYCANVVLVNKTDPDQKIRLSAIAKPKSPITRSIGSAEEWNEVMKEFGQSYGNFVLTGDIDMSKLPAGEELITNVRINSLTGQGGMRTIKGITHTVNGKSDSLISNCLTGIENVQFENISWTVAENDVNDHVDVGLIGLNQGHIRNVEFTGVTIDSGNGNRTGCVSYNLGEITDVTLKDIQVTSDNVRAGGLVGQTARPVRRIKAMGTLTEDQEHPGSYTSTYEVRGYQYVGGIVGEGQACESIFVNGIRVLGENPLNKNGTISRIGGIVGTGEIVRAGGNNEENAKLSSTIVNSVVETAEPQAEKSYEASYVGGAIGYGNTYFVHGKNLLVRGPDANGVGGISGHSASYSDITTVLEEEAEKNDYTITQTRIAGRENIGGISGRAQSGSSEVSFVEVEATKTNAGGISGMISGGIGSCVVDSVSVKAPLNAGGLAGYATGGGADNSLVSRSEVTGGYNVGGLIGYMEKAGSASGNGVVDTSITAEKSQPGGDGTPDNAGGESNAGGLIGKADIVNYVIRNYVKDSQITGQGDHVGGLLGSAKGGHYSRNFSYAEVKTEGQNAGGLIGKLTGVQPALTTEYRNAKLYTSYSYSTVKAADYAGGFVGMYTCDEGEFYDLTPENTYGLLALGQVECRGPHGSLFVNADETKTELKAQGAYLRVFDEAKLTTASAEGQPQTKTAKDLYTGTWDAEKPVSAGGTKADEITPALSGVLRVTSENLMDKRLYANTYEKGGMNWNQNWIFDGLGRMESYSADKVHSTYGNVGLKISVGKTGNPVEIPAKANSKDPGTVYVIPDPIPNETPIVAEILWDEAEGESCQYYWYRLFEPEKDASQVNIKNGDAVHGKEKQTELAGRGYYAGRINTNGTWKWTNIIKVDTPAYLPYVTSDSAVVRGAQEGFTSELKDGEPLTREDGSYKTYDGRDLKYYGGIKVPAEVSGTIGTLDLKDGAAQVYPSGPDTINVELNADYEGLTRLTVEAGGKKLLDEKPDKRVYTLPYDYQSTVTVTAESGESKSSVSWDATELRRTVMVWGDDYYYTSDGKLYNGSGLCLDRQILHLYGGKALAADGTVYEAESGRVLGEVGRTVADGAEKDEALPVAEASYEGRRIRTYGSFTQIATAANATPFNAALAGAEPSEETVREQQLFVKDGTLFAVENSQSFRGFVMDSYNGQTFMSALNDKGELKDYGDALKTPEHFRRKQIAHMTNAMDSDEPIVLVRYATGEARGFNYVTGEELPVENAFSDVSFLDFASGFMEDLVGQADLENKAFADLKKLEEELKLSPITEEQLAMAQKVTEGALGNDGAPEESRDEEGQTEDLESYSEAEQSEKDPAEKDPVISDSRDDGQEADGLDVDGSAEADGLAEGEGDEVIDGLADGDGDEVTDGLAEGDGEPEKPDADEQGSSQSKKPDGAEQDDSQPEKPDVGEEDDGQSKKSDDAGESGGQGDGDDRAGGAQQTERSDYVYAFNTDEETYKLYNSRELLGRKEEELLSEQEKLETLQAAGMFAGDTYVKQETATRQEKKGLTMFAFAAMAALSLSGVLIYRKGRRKDDKR